MTNMWMVRAGRRARFLEEFRENNVVAIGWTRLEDLSGLTTSEAVSNAVSEAWPEWSKGKARLSASQLYRFAHEIQPGDRVITYDPEKRVYLLGNVVSKYKYQPNRVSDWGHVREVDWQEEVNRDALSTPTKNSLGAISTLFRVPEEAAAEIEAVASGHQAPVEEPLDDDGASLELLEDIEERATEFIKDKISSLDWDEMQELVAGILRAMGYKTEVSPAGPDRGKDIVASPDGFGFESPRIIVEVKHRKGQMGAQALRSFLGGRHKDDKGLYVSTGGFSKDAHYEAERANIPVTLLALDGLVDKLLEHYDQIDPEIQRLVSLKKVYWPV